MIALNNFEDLILVDGKFTAKIAKITSLVRIRYTLCSLMHLSEASVPFKRIQLHAVCIEHHYDSIGFSFIKILSELQRPDSTVNCY